jgi:hypothetical protein
MNLQPMSCMRLVQRSGAVSKTKGCDHAAFDCLTFCFYFSELSGFTGNDFCTVIPLCFVGVREISAFSGA